MKKLLVLALISFLLSNIMLAQTHHWANIHHSETRKHYTAFQQKSRDSIVNNNISKAVEFVKYYTKKGKLKRSIVGYEKYYDSLGNLIKENNYTRKGKLYRTYTHGYNADGVETSYRSYNAKGKLLSGWDLSFNDKGLLSKATSYKRKEGQILWIQQYEYNNDSNAIKIQSLNKKGEVIYTTEYDYYEDGQKKEVRSYNKKGKLKSVLKYDCLPTGVLANGKKTDTLTVCLKDNIDEDGNSIYTVERMQKNGKIVRSITKISKDKKYSEVSFINHKDQLMFKRTYAYDSKGRLNQTKLFYPKNSRRYKHLRYVIQRSDDNKQLITEKYGYKNRLETVSTLIAY